MADDIRIAAFLKELYDGRPHVASQGFYRENLELLVAMVDGDLTQKNVDAMTGGLHLLFQIPQQTVEAAHLDFCDSLLDKVLNDAIALGVDRYNDDIEKSVRKAANTAALLLGKETAMSSVSKAVRKIYVDYIKHSQAAANGKESEIAKDLKKMMAFNTLVVTELVKDIKGESNSNDVSTEITLKDDLPETERTELYRIYAIFGVIIFNNHDSNYVLLNQLGGILGLTGKQRVEVHRSLANKMKPKKSRETLLRKTVDRVVKQAGYEFEYDINKMISENLRETLFRKTVDDIFSSGTGEFNKEEVYVKIASDLNLNKKKARGVVRQIAQTRLSNSLIQAVALLRQRNDQGVVSSLNNLLACDKAVPSRPLLWEELANLYKIYMKSDPTPEKLDRLQFLLGIDDSTAASLRETGNTLMLGDIAKE